VVASATSWELPCDWQWEPLGQIAESTSGSPAPQGDKYFEGGRYPFVRVQDLGKCGRTSALIETRDKVNDHAVESLPLRKAPKGAILLPKSGESTFLNHRAMLAAEAYFVGHLACVVPRPGVMGKYLYHWLCSFDVAPYVTATTTPTLRLSDIAAFPVPVAPVPEQQRIVAQLDRIERAMQAQRGAIEKTKALVRAALAQVFDVRDGLPEGWNWAELGDLIAWGPQNGLYKHSSYYGEGTPIVRIDSFYEGRIVDFGGLKRLRLSDDETESYRLQENDVLLNRVNSIEYVGKSALVRGLGEDTVFESNMMRFRVDEDRVLPEFVIAFLCSQSARQQILKRVHLAINQVSINQKDVRSFRIPVPSLPTQRQIVQKVDRIQQAPLAQEDNLAKTKTLMQSALHRAFRGRL
jgi:type I restriction enzyme S subunit